MTKAEVHNELKRVERVVLRDHHNQILTNEERRQLATYLIYQMR